ncbi:MAG TPA: uroporphyrinogen decarboxylase, partial [Candidatus Polarisedimenticolia bacterium]|nr:uroporphyrinogen decarboxylase [Candidatus Polarisedimenticolia bacterium]
MPGSDSVVDSRFMRACRRQSVDCTPIWVMRQAGRFLPEYRQIRAGHSLLDICRNPDLACEVTMQPVRRFDLDAAILFSDLLVPVAALGVDFDIVEKKGPVLARPVCERQAIGSLKDPGDLREVDYVFEAVRRVRAALDREGRAIPLLGFAGAPFTLASYLVEGGPSRHFTRTKLLMYSEPDTWADLMSRLADMTIGYLERQFAAGVSAAQLFDSWVGCLSPSEYRRYTMEPTRRIFTAMKKLGAPMIHFGTMNATLLDLMAEAGGDVLSVDWRIPLDQVRRRFPGHAVQGNLDPLAL